MEAHIVLALTVMDSGVGIIGWIIIGLIAGALAGMVMRGGGYGIVGDIIVGIIGALIGGFILSLLGVGVSGFWTTLVAAFIGACILIALLHAFSGRRTVV
ncbi:MAG TPA: GlsB/YeaQ/YmgE family stress response membrane protein [Chloroflexota bacterium]|nr:GlsB/YeaQ/YmgE family stress response membrane protein [Chloroflexota bacterium]